MSRDCGSVRFVARNASKSSQSESNENEFENLSNSIHFPPSRTPLNTIPDPSQCQAELQELDHDSNDKFEATRAVRSSEKRFEASDHQLTQSRRIGNVGLNYGTPKVPGRGKSQSEPNSAQSTPARSVSRVSNIGALGAFTGPRPPQYAGVKGGSSSRVYRGVSIANIEPQVEIPQFELEEDPSFWNDYNVQVLIRIRPVSNTEGYGRCLRQESAQTLVWLGHPEVRFTFDHIACETISQEKLFRVAGLPMVDNCMSGYNSCMFAYGQTGSGKTYTMMGEICEMDGKLNEDCGITPRVFEYLFARIKEEEENRRDERLKYSCKCSFLEIYNEQITDLLEPSSTNLQLREDLTKGVYVENLMEYNVRTVNDVLNLLLQGAANRKMAATHMNSESSRSHSVFTCIIESRWERDSMTHLRFGRLNLVDLAGSERQKSSGAEGDRLKEAANINKSLSTLSLVIMSLVDLAHGKHRHVPYRDSRLTFLLQDSLGGNSKTTIIANVTPSICSANETLSTLKFAQRAKLIQNNAKVNEDASGDVTALQRQIQQLKGQLSFLMKHQDIPRPLSQIVPSFQRSSLGDFPNRNNSSVERNMYNNHDIPNGQKRKTKCLESTLIGALRREKLAETVARRLEAEIEQMNRLAHQREEDAQRIKMILRFREEKIKRLELLADGLVTADKYLVDENNALVEEIQLLGERIDRNPELTRFATENIRLIEQLRLFQDFHERGERETLLAEVSELRDKLLETLEVEENHGQHKILSRRENQVPDAMSGGYCSLGFEQLPAFNCKVQKMQDNNPVKELTECKNMNSKLIREVDDLRSELRKYTNWNQAAYYSVADYSSKDPKEFKEIKENSGVETISLKSDSGDDSVSYNQLVDQNKNDQKMCDALVLQSSDTLKELMDARVLMEAMESEQVLLIEELQFVQQENHRLTEILSNEDKVERPDMLKFDNRCTEIGCLENQNLNLVKDGSKEISTIDFQVKLDTMTKDLEEARLLSNQYLDDHASQLSRDHQTELIRDEVEMETTKTILHLQEEVVALQSELQEKLCSMAEDNERLRNCLAAKEDEIRELHVEWESASLELTSFLLDGSKSLRDASGQIKSIACSFPHVNIWIGEHVEKAAKASVEKEEMILLLQKSLEDAQKTVVQMEQKLNSLKGATMALTEIQQLENDANSYEAIQLTTGAEKRANAALLAANSQSDHPKVVLTDNVEGDSSETGSHHIFEQVELARLGLVETENAFSASCADAEMYLSSLQIDIHKTVSLYKELVQNCAKDIREMRKNFAEFKVNHGNPQIHTVEIPSRDGHKFQKDENQQQMLHQIIKEFAETNGRLNTMRACVDKILIAEDFVEVDRWTTDSSTPGSYRSAENAAENRYNESSSSCCYESPGKVTDQTLDLEFEGGSIFSSDNQESDKSERLVKKLSDNETALLFLRNEFTIVYDAFVKLNVKLATLFSEKEIEDYSHADSVGFQESLEFMNNKEQHLLRAGLNQLIMPEMHGVLGPSELVMQEAEAGCCNTREFAADMKVSQASSVFTKFEEAHAAMKEADFMLNALLKANDNAKQLTGMWKQAGEDLMVEKASLIEEIEELKSSICVKDRENEILQDQIHYSLIEISSSVSVVEVSFLQMQRDVEEMFKAVYSDALKMAQDILHYMCFSRSSLEDISAETMERGFASFVLHQCHVGEYFCKLRSLNGLRPSILQKGIMNHLGKSLIGENESTVNVVPGKEEGDQAAVITRLGASELGLVHDDPINENLELQKELERKEVLLKGLLFDFSLLQESASTTKDMKDETERLIVALSQVQHELQMKTSQLDDMWVQHRRLEGCLADTETALFSSNSDLEQAKETIDILSGQNSELRVLLEDIYLKRSETEEQLEEQREVVKSLEKEILCTCSSTEKQLIPSIKGIEDDLRRITCERDQLHEQVGSLQDRLDMAYGLADENEAIAVEAREKSEASKIYAEQKEEEVKILERSVEELECTINVLEKKVYEMEDEVERHRMIRDSLELELQALRHRLLTVENFTENWDSEYSNSEQSPENQLSRKLHDRSLELHEAHKQIRVLEEERSEQAKEIKQYKEYISELVLHAEAQASQYQHKYKTLEAMVHEVKTDSQNLASEAPTFDKTEKSSVRARGSSSPFRCITNLVQQMNLEKDQELSIARLRIEELKALAASRQKEVCMLNTRLAAAESMTHDVIRDLLGVKLDMTNYANLIDQYRLQKLVEDDQQQTQDSVAMEQEILNLRRQVNDLIEERERCISEVNKRESAILATQMTVEQLQERDQLLTAQNEMLKMDKTNLQRRVAELDDMVKKLFGTQNTQPRIHQQINSLSRAGNSNTDLGKRLAHSEKLLLRVNDELAQYHKSDGSHPHDKLDRRRSTEPKFRKQKAQFS